MSNIESFPIHFQFIAGFFEGNKLNSFRTQLTRLHDTVHSLGDKSERDLDTHQCLVATIECEPSDNQQSIIHVLTLINRKSIQFTFIDEIENKWEKLPLEFDWTMQEITSFRDAIMISVDEQVLVFHMDNGSVSDITNVALDIGTVEHVALPTDVKCTNLVLFCQLNDKIYCFPHSEQQRFHRYDSVTGHFLNGSVHNCGCEMKFRRSKISFHCQVRTYPKC